MNAHQAITKSDESVVPDTQHPYTTMKTSSDPTLPAPSTASSPRRRNRCRRRCILSTCCGIFLILTLALGITILIHWIVIQPKNGQYDLVDAHLQTLNLTQNGTQSYNLDTDMDVKILLTNPNHKMGFDIKGINVHAFYVGEEIGENKDSVAPFYQERRNEITLGSEIRPVNFKAVILSEDVGGALQSEIGRNNVTLLVVMNAKVRNDHGMLRALHPYRKLHLSCWVSLMVPNATAPGNLISKSCSVHRD